MNKNDPPLVSILIPTYNSGKYVSAAIESALSQTYKNIEIVVSDNDSTDNTLVIVNGYAAGNPNIKVNKNDTNLGPVRNWRRCAENAKGDFAALLFSDDILLPDFVDSTLPYLSDPAVGFVYSAVGKIDRDGNESSDDLFYKLAASGVYPMTQFIHGHLLLGDDMYPLSPGCSLFRADDIRKNLMEEISDELGADFMRHGAGPDLNVYLLCGLRYASFAYVCDKKVLFRGHEGNLSKSGKVNLAYALAKSWFASKFYAENRQTGIEHFRAAHFWRLVRLGYAGLYKKSMSWDSSPWSMAYLDWISYLLKRLVRKSNGKY